MPWHLSDDHSDCDGWAVVKDSDNSVVGCHPTKVKAQKQLAALNINVEENMADALIERRQVPIDNVEVRQDNGTVHFTGHAAVFENMTNIGQFRERVAHKAFDKSVRDAHATSPVANVVLLYNHNQDSVMASTKAGSLRLKSDKVGLATDADLDPTDTDVQRVLPKMRRGDLDRMSFAFRAIKDDWDDHPEDGGPPIRTLQEVQLFDVSVVTFPAYDATDASVMRSAEKVYERRMEELKVAEEEEIEPEVIEAEVPEPPEEQPTETKEQSEPLETADQPSRDEHSLAERQALRDRRLAIIEEYIKGG